VGFLIVDFRLQIDERHKAQGARYKVQGGVKNKKGMMPCTLNPEP
jgi:hypothetical protein